MIPYLLVGYDILIKKKEIPFGFDENNPNILMLAVSDPLDFDAQEDISMLTNLEVQPYVATNSGIVETLDKYFGQKSNTEDLEKFAKEKGLVHDEDTSQHDEDVANSPIVKIVKEMIEKAERFRVVKDGLDTIIIGRPNVGKSSLLNALLEEDKAIVTDIAGTTRDLVEGKVKLDNITLNLIDTAGIRDDAEAIEKIGIEKTMKAIDKAQLIILVIDASDINEKDEELINTYKDRNLVVVYNKADLNKYGEIAICAKDGDIKALKDHLNQMYQDDIDLVNEDILNNERQIALMRNCLEELNNMYKSIDVDTSDVIVTYLSEAYDYLCQILGKEYREDLIDHMFKNFCLGK